MCAPKQLRHFHNLADLESDEWELKDEDIAALDMEGTAEPVEMEDKAPMEEMMKDESENDGYHNVQAVLDSKYRQGWRFLTLWEGYAPNETT